MPDDAPSADALKARIIRARLGSLADNPSVAGQAERDRGIAHPPEAESTAAAFRRGLGEGWGDQPPGQAFAEQLPFGVREQLKPIQTALRGVSALTRGAGEALSSTGRLGRDIAAMPEAFMGSPGSLRTAVPSGIAPRLRIPESAGAVEQSIADTYTRAVKPSVKGKQTAEQLERSQVQARSAVSSIVANKPNLFFSDFTGEGITGELPKSLEQFGDAVSQTKQSVFEKYNTMAQATGERGIDVPLAPVVNELRTIVNDTVSQGLHPELVKYAQERADALEMIGSWSAPDAQRGVRMLNSTLKNFYNNPDYSNAARASIDSMIANQLRIGLDEAVETAVGPGYQALKNEHGALQRVEQDVVKRSQVVARQERGGGILGRISDVASAEEIIRGFVTLNPKAIVTGAALKGWQQYVKYLRSPNRAVTKLFEKAEKQEEAAPPRSIGLPSFPASQAISAIPFFSRPPTPDETMRRAVGGQP